MMIHYSSCAIRELYEEKRRRCLEVQEQFYDISKGWGAALKSVLVAIQNRRELSEVLEERTRDFQWSI